MGSTARKIAALVAATVMAMAGLTASVLAQGDTSAPRSNLELLRLLAGRIAASSCDSVVHADTPRVQLTVLPRESAWVIEDEVTAALRRHGVRVLTGAAPFSAEFGIIRLQILYENIRREGMFGAKLVDRVAAAGLRVRILDSRSGAVLMSGDVGLEQRDTVAVSDVERLESPTLPVTHGALPAEGWFTNLLEPLVMLGTVALAVVLLFTVRS